MKYRTTRLLMIVSILLTITLGVVTNIATNVIPVILQPYLWCAWPVLVALIVMYLFVYLRSEDNQSLLIPSRSEQLARSAIMEALQLSRVNAPKKIPFYDHELFLTLREFWSQFDVSKVYQRSYLKEQFGRWRDLWTYYRYRNQYYKENILPVLIHIGDWQDARQHIREEQLKGNITQEAADKALQILDEQRKKG